MKIYSISNQNKQDVRSFHGLTRRDSISYQHNALGEERKIYETYYPFRDETRDVINSNIKKLIAKNASVSQKEDSLIVKTYINVSSVLPFTETEFNHYKNGNDISASLKETIERAMRKFKLQTHNRRLH